MRKEDFFLGSEVCVRVGTGYGVLLANLEEVLPYLT